MTAKVAEYGEYTRQNLAFCFVVRCTTITIRHAIPYNSSSYFDLQRVGVEHLNGVLATTPEAACDRHHASDGTRGGPDRHRVRVGGVPSPSYQQQSQKLKYMQLALL